jgi:hypothetical protein
MLCAGHVLNARDDLPQYPNRSEYFARLGLHWLRGRLAVLLVEDAHLLESKDEEQPSVVQGCHGGERSLEVDVPMGH